MNTTVLYAYRKVMAKLYTNAKVGLVAYIGNKRYQFTVQTESWCFAYTQFRFFVKQRNTLHVHVAYLKIVFDLIFSMVAPIGGLLECGVFSS